MKKGYLFICLFLLIPLENKSQHMVADTIKLSSVVEIYQEKKFTDDTITWSLILSYKPTHEECGDIKLKEESVDLKDPFLNRNYPLHIPKMIAAYQEDKTLLICIYESLKVYLYMYDFGDTYTTKRYLLGELMPGSVDNLGAAEAHMHGKKIKQDYLFDFSYGRQVLGDRAEYLLSYNTQSGKVIGLGLRDNIHRVKDDKKLFLTMDLDNNSNEIAAIIQEIYPFKNEKISYLDYLDDFSSYFSNLNSNRRSKGMIYFFCEGIKGNRSILRYDNYNNEWLINKYEELEIEAIYVDFMTPGM